MSRLLSWADGIALPMFVLRKMPDDKIEFVHANAALSTATGIPHGFLAGKTPEEAFPTRLAARLISNYQAGFTSDDPISYEEMIDLEGETSWWQTTLSRPEGFQDTVLLGFAIPITTHKQRTFATASDLAELSARFDELKLYSTMAAHDARSPLATVSSLLDLICEGFDDHGDGKLELLRMCSETVDEALAQITATLRRGQEIKAGRPSDTTVDLGRLCQDIAAMVDPEDRLSIEVPEGCIRSDEVLLQMALRNLMSNAARYTCGRIHVTVSQSEAEPDLLVFHVADDGPGLPPGITVASLTRATQAEDNGHGFGLASIAQLANARGGDLETERGPDGPNLPGAVFRLTLPGVLLDSSTPTTKGHLPGSEEDLKLAIRA